MIEITPSGVYYRAGQFLPGQEGPAAGLPSPDEARKGTMAYGILAAHNTLERMDRLAIRFDAMASHDITYVGIIQTARASGLKEFPLPYVLTNCHNSLCAVGGTINEDDHVFGLSAAKKYGGEFVPAHQAVIHSYMRERYAAPGRMILGSDSHTRYGAYGTMAIGEGGPELARQLLCKTYDIAYPKVIAIYLTGAPKPGVGPQDVALALIGATFKEGVVKNAVMEFFGPGVASLSMDYRAGIDVMTTETACLSSVWSTDERTREHLTALGRGDQYKAQAPAEGAYYDGVIALDLSTVEPMIALPFHPSNAYTIREFKANMADLLHQVDVAAAEQLGVKNAAPLEEKIVDGKFHVDQGVIAGCSGGTYQNLVRAAEILKGSAIGADEFWLSCYPGSMPINLELTRKGYIADLMAAGATIRSCFCGPCFGAGDVPANGAFSIRHSTRNFPNREGSKPGEGQISYVALMDARSIAATARNNGVLTGADELADIPADRADEDWSYDDSAYKSRVYYGVGRAKPDTELVYGPNIADWPEQIALPQDLLLTAAAAIYDPVTTTDELIPSGETSSYRSNPLRLSEFALSRKDPQYVPRAKAVLAVEQLRRKDPSAPEVVEALGGRDGRTTGLGSFVMALKPGDGSAREQAASCQRVLGGCADLCAEFATKRYRSNVVNWGMLPFIAEDVKDWNVQPGNQLWLPGIRAALEKGEETISAVLIQNGQEKPVTVKLPGITQEERDIILAGCLINYYAK
ncbi:hydratase [Pseudoflavonifractor sp. MSJ-37]|uniref:hydratase n=1 Tax=Pseudoflavonifractor sp. MSJ-37 TaxID=2841531 RepID=UPI001C128B56|nr:hydratase [Pseudoflavonifractor sp. MSJ-37]MBU5434482.1 hydratase [Pseudoflavonifractor sp. MSJ-37]